MGTVHAHHSDLVYLRQLVGAGFDGIASARHELHGRVFTAASRTAVWTPPAIGAAVGMLSTRLMGKRRSMVMGGLIGGVVGLGAVAAWASE